MIEIRGEEKENGLLVLKLYGIRLHLVAFASDWYLKDMIKRWNETYLESGHKDFLIEIQ